MSFISQRPFEWFDLGVTGVSDVGNLIKGKLTGFLGNVSRAFRPDLIFRSPDPALQLLACHSLLGG